MKVSLNWLREYVDLPPTTDELVSLLTMAGVEVEGVETTGCAIANVIVAQVRESVQHPNADRLSVCQVDDGSGAARQIVCGAKNYKVGDKVPLALPGAQMAPDFVIKVGKLRGVESQGMMCSAKELGIAEDAEGLLILPEDAKLGAPIGELFPGDTVLDLEITPNRADLLSYAGIAREVATLTGKPLRSPVALSTLSSQPSTLCVADAALCPLYTLRTIRGVKVGPSPDWLRTKLEAAGLRSINNVVDVSNYVLLELGHPLHAFDAAKLTGDLQVRLATEGEEFLALDGKTYRLATRDLVIADQRHAVAIAGVMGGEETGVTEATTDLLLETAVFQQQSVRRTGRTLGLASDSSYRFERGVDPAGVAAAAQRAVELIVQLAGGTAEPEARVGEPRAAIRTALGIVPLRAERLRLLLGIDVPAERVREILCGFGLRETAQGWEVPSFRPDLTREADLIEEIARVIGMSAIPSRVQAQFSAASASDRAYDRAMELRRAFASQGLHEARSITLVPAEPLAIGATQVATEHLQRVKNPMIDDQVVLRPNLLHGLLSALRENLRAGAASVRLFELGRVFSTRKPEEFPHAALVLSGASSERSWRAAEGRAYDLFDLYGLVASVLGTGVSFEKSANDTLALALVVNLNDKPVGFAGQLWPADARALDATAPVVFAEIDLAALAKAETQSLAKKYRDIPRFPETTRDIAMLVPLDLPHARVAATLTGANEPLLAGVELFDVFADPSGAKIPADRRSLAYSLTYRSTERTLTADEVNAAHAKLKDRLKALGATLRE
ncbi:MAG: phenylalanine--tRNA ligase subunit beta [Chthoniobacteraceae bacterium]